VNNTTTNNYVIISPAFGYEDIDVVKTRRNPEIIKYAESVEP
jgi:hypothetical protein